HALRSQELKNIRQRKAMLLGERDVQAVVGGRRLQFEIEAAAEALPQRQAPSFIDAPAKGRVDDQLHPASLVEESFGDDCRLRRHIAQYGAPFERVLNQLLGARKVEPTFLSQPAHGVSDRGKTAPSFYRSHAGQAVADFFAQFA